MGENIVAEFWAPKMSKSSAHENFTILLHLSPTNALFTSTPPYTVMVITQNNRERQPREQCKSERGDVVYTKQRAAKPKSFSNPAKL